MTATHPVDGWQIERYPCHFKLQVIAGIFLRLRQELDRVLHYALRCFPAADMRMLVPAAEVR